MGDHHCHPDTSQPHRGRRCPFPSLSIFVLKFCNFVTDVGETFGKYSKERGFGRFRGVYKVTLQTVTKISFCKQREVCKQQKLTEICRKTALFTNISATDFCITVLYQIQSDWFTNIYRRSIVLLQNYRNFGRNYISVRKRKYLLKLDFSYSKHYFRRNLLTLHCFYH